MSRKLFGVVQKHPQSINKHKNSISTINPFNLDNKKKEIQNRLNLIILIIEKSNLKNLVRSADLVFHTAAILYSLENLIYFCLFMIKHISNVDTNFQT